MFGDPTPDVAAFRDPFNERFILAESFEDADLPELLVPFQWYEHEQRFLGFHYVLRSAMARVLAFAGISHDPPVGRQEKGEWIAAAQFLEGFAQRGEIAVAAHRDPLDLLRSACRSAQVRAEGRSRAVLDEVGRMREFHEGWRGIVPDEVLDLDDLTVFRQVDDSAAALVQTKNVVYVLFRRDGKRHLDALTGFVHGLLPADQCYFLHALDAFPNDPDVLAFFDAFLASTRSDHCRSEAAKFRERVATGQQTSGYEP